MLLIWSFLDFELESCVRIWLDMYSDRLLMKPPRYRECGQNDKYSEFTIIDAVANGEDQCAKASFTGECT